MKKAQVIWSVFVIAVTAAIVYFVWFHLSRYLANDRLVVTSRNEQRELYELTIALLDAENGVRGYMLTSLPQFEENFRSAMRAVDRRLVSAEKVVPPEMHARFEDMSGLIVARRAMLEQIVARAASTQPREAIDQLKSESVMGNGARIRARMVELLVEADSRLQTRLAACRQSMVTMTRWVLIGVSSLVLSSTALVWLMWRDNLRQRRISAELAAARDAAIAGTRARDEFLNVVSHELRTPLTPALMSISAMEHEPGTTQELRDEYSMIRRQLELEARLIDDLLDVSKILRGDLALPMADVSVHTILNHLAAGLQQDAASKKISLQSDLRATQDHLPGNESRLHQALWHVMSNAIKFSHADGVVTIRTTSANGSIIITVSDNGIGLTAEQFKTLFTPFWQGDSSITRRFGGLGVGLAIAKSVIELHRGDIRAESLGRDQGATFTITLPLTA